jgi:hypothetical protein
MWVATACVAAWLVRGGRPPARLLDERRLSHRFVRMVATVLVVLGIGEGAAARDPATVPQPGKAQAGQALVLPGDAPYRTELDPPFARRHAEQYARVTWSVSPWMRIKPVLTILDAGGELSANQREMLEQSIKDARPDTPMTLGPTLAQVIGEELAACDADRPAPRHDPDTLAGILSELESVTCYDAWYVGFIWRRTDSPQTDQRARKLTGLYHELENYARMTVALRRAQARSGPVVYQPWRSKAAPPQGHVAYQISPALFRELEAQYAQADAGAWHREATVRLRVTSGRLSVHRRGATIDLAEDEVFTMRRLDVVSADANAPVVLAAASGKLTLSIPAATTAAPRNLHQYLTDESQARARRWAVAAAEGDRSATVQLQWHLPLTHAAIRRQLDTDPALAVPDALRMLLIIFDE